MAYRAPGAGELRDRIRIERKGTESDGMGGSIDTWSPLLTEIPAKIAARKGGEEVRSKRLSGLAPFDIEVRSSDDTTSIKAGDRCVNERSGETYNIKWVGTLDGRFARFIMLDCEAGGVIDG